MKLRQRIFNSAFGTFSLVNGWLNFFGNGVGLFFGVLSVRYDGRERRFQSIHTRAGLSTGCKGVDCKEIGIPIGLTEALSYRAIIISVSSLPEFPVVGGIALYGESTEASAFHRMIDKDQLIPYCFHLLLIFVGEATVLVL